MLAACITAPILYKKSRKESQTTVLTTTTISTSTTTTTTPTTTTTTTTDKTINPCYGHVCKSGETCFEIDDQATCVSDTIGFLTHDKMVKLVDL